MNHTVTKQPDYEWLGGPAHGYYGPAGPDFPTDLEDGDFIVTDTPVKKDELWHRYQICGPFLIYFGSEEPW